jgi:fatty-acyl-CoA synthase
MWNLNEDEAILNGLPLFHVGGAILLSLSAISHGTRILMPSPGGLRTPAVVENIWRLVERHKLTIMGGIPTSHVAFNQVPVGDADLSLLKYGFTGGSATPVQIEKEMIEKMGCKMLHLYGATEASISITMTPAGSEGVIGSEGIRLPYEELKIVRLESLESTPEECLPNESGVVLLKGPNVIPGYLDPSQNQGTLTDDGWLVTGDLGHLNEEGFLFLTGRSKDLIIRSGHNIDPSIIEESAMQHPAIAMAAAVGKPDEYAGELPTLYVQLNPGATTSPEDILVFLAENISERPALPKEVIVIETIPTTAVGKIFKPELRWDIAKKHFNQQLSYLKDEGLEVCAEVGESKSLGRICKVTLSGKTRRDKKSVEAEIAAKLGKYQYTQHEVVWEQNN